MGLTPAGRDKVLNKWLTNSGVAIISFISLHTGDPGTTGANEVTGDGYSRKSIIWDASTHKNTNLIQMENTGSTSWGTITHAGFWTDESTDVLMGTVALAVAKAALPGSIVSVPIGDLIASATGLTANGREMVLDVLCGASVGRPTSISLHTGDPGDTGSANILSATGYSSASVTWGAASSGTSTNTNKPLWANNSGSAWPQVTHWSAATMAKGALTTPITLADGDMMEFPIGSIPISLT